MFFIPASCNCAWSLRIISEALGMGAENGGIENGRQILWVTVCTVVANIAVNKWSRKTISKFER